VATVEAAGRGHSGAAMEAVSCGSDTLVETTGTGAGLDGSLVRRQ
jgi:hypothetical protein